MIGKFLSWVGKITQKVVDHNNPGISNDKKESEKVLREMQELKDKGKQNPNPSNNQ